MSRFSDYTYDYFMAELLKDPPNGINVQEGSLFYSSVSKMALRLEDAYNDMDELYDNMDISTADLEHLIVYGAEEGCAYKDATYATVKAVFNQAYAAGDRFSAVDADYNYTIIDTIDASTFTYELECETEGTGPNSYLGDIEPIEDETGFTSGVITALTQAGTEAEDEEEYRYRLLAYKANAKPYAGNRPYWKKVMSDEGAGGIKAYRRASDATNYLIYYLTASYATPTASEISALQAVIDPESSGEGDGYAPIGNIVKLMAAESVTVTVTGTVTYGTAQSWDTLGTAITAAIEAYMLSLRKSWADTGEEGYLIARLSGVESAILGVEGVTDLTNLTLNGSAANVNLTKTQIPVLGTVTMS